MAEPQKSPDTKPKPEAIRVRLVRLREGTAVQAGMPRELRAAQEADPKKPVSPSGSAKQVESMELYPSPLGLIGVLVTWAQAGDAKQPATIVPWGVIERADLA